ncbi:hypothetical protein ACOSP7_029570 [Xanthoceras sorbifolium]|uniref:Homeobox-leucine zipper protein n=1 Tax=Xanthoceras sorbifolium TaxID=99658 RepID=A0ABQ8HAX2_9ROSI|nr:hypothetical protein JRO89_XS12G0037400 [Xanthoceras sorbifolium]
MDWNSNIIRTFVPRPETTFDFLYPNYNYDQYPGMELKHAAMEDKPLGLVPAMDHKNNNYGSQEKKKRLTSDQIDSLERSFQEEIKLDPDRKMKLSRELGLQPRQIAVWFQNKRARWKTKQLGLLYDSLKQEFDVVSREKHKLQDEVMKLKSMLRDQQATRKQAVSTGQAEISGGEETVESTSVAIRSSNHHQIGEGTYVLNIEEYNPAVSSAFWGVPPSNYP